MGSISALSDFAINNVSVLSTTTLAPTVVKSSLTSLGTLLNLNVSNHSTISTLYVDALFPSNLNVTVGNITSLVNSTGDITNLITESGTIGTFYTNNGTIGTLYSSNGTMGSLYLSRGIIRTLNSSMCSITSGTVSSMYIRSSTANNMVITSASISSLYTKDATVDILDGNDINYDSGSISSLYTEDAVIDTLEGTDISYESGTISSLYAEYAVNDTLEGTDISYESGTISSLSVEDAVISTLEGTDISYESGTISSLSVEDAVISTLEGTDISYESGTIDSLSVDDAVISTLEGTDISYESGTISSLSVEDADISTLEGTDISYESGTISSLSVEDATISTLEGTDISYECGTISSLSVDDAVIDALEGDNISYESGTISSLSVEDAVIDALEGDYIDYTSGTLSSLYTTNIIGRNLNMNSGTTNTMNINSLSVNSISIQGGNLTTTNNSITNLYSNVGTISTLYSNNQVCTSSTVSNQRITTLTATTTTINSMNSTNSNITTGTVSTLYSNNALINSINNTNANITTGTVSTLYSNNSIINSRTGTNANITNGTMNNLYTTNHTSSTLYVTTSSLTNANITTGSVSTLYSNNIMTNLLTGTNANITNGTIPTLYSTHATINSINGTNANITSGTISTLFSNNATTVLLSGTSCTMNNLYTNNQTTNNLNVTSSIITNANITTGTVSTLYSNNSIINSINGTNANITNGTVSTLYSNNAIINSINGTNANITNGTISTLYSNNSNINSINGTNANISSGTVSSLVSSNANLTSGTCNNLYTTSHTCDILNVTNGTMSSLFTTVGTVNRLSATNASISSGTISALYTNGLSIFNNNILSTTMYTSGTTGNLYPPSTTMTSIFNNLSTYTNGIMSTSRFGFNNIYTSYAGTNKLSSAVRGAGNYGATSYSYPVIGNAASNGVGCIFDSTVGATWQPAARSSGSNDFSTSSPFAYNNGITEYILSRGSYVTGIPLTISLPEAINLTGIQLTVPAANKAPGVFSIYSETNLLITINNPSWDWTQSGFSTMYFTTRGYYNQFTIIVTNLRGNGGLLAISKLALVGNSYSQNVSFPNGSIIQYNPSTTFDSNGNNLRTDTDFVVSTNKTVYTNSTSLLKFTFGNSGAWGGIGIQDTTTMWGSGYQGDMVFYTVGTSSIYDLTERMRIQSGGNVGIGTTNPQGLLHLASGYSNGGAAFEQYNSQILLTTTQNGSSGLYGVGIRASVPASSTVNQCNLIFTTTDNNGSQIARMSILGSSNSNIGGYVGIGFTTPLHPVHIYSNYNTGNSGIGLGIYTPGLSYGGSGTIIFGDNYSTNNAGLIRYVKQSLGNSLNFIGISANGTPADQVCINTAGYMGIGTTAPRNIMDITIPAGQNSLGMTMGSGTYNTLIKQHTISANDGGLVFYNNSPLTINNSTITPVTPPQAFAFGTGTSNITVSFYSNWGSQNGSGSDLITSSIYFGSNSTYSCCMRSVVPNGFYSDYQRIDLCTTTASNTASVTPRLTIMAMSGFVGIGTTTPRFPLDVYGGGSRNASSLIYFNTNSASIQTGNFGTNIGIRAQGIIFSEDAMMVPSDMRIKTNIELADTSIVLNKILELPLRTYNYIDTVQDGNNTVYGMISQYVRQVFPEAITLTTQIVPSIYKLATNVSLSTDGLNVIITVNIPTTSGLKDGCIVELIIANMDNKYKTTVVSFTESQIVVPVWPDFDSTQNIFVYGIEVDDFHILNKDYIAVVCMGGIQELANKVTTQQQTITELQQQVATLQQQMALVLAQLNINTNN